MEVAISLKPVRGTIGYGRGLPRRPVGLVVFTGLLALAGCTGGMHQRGDHQIALLGTFGGPIKGDGIWPQGDGHADNGALMIDYGYFFQDRFAVLAGLTPYRIYNQSDGDSYAGEFQLGFRYYFWECELGNLPLGFYAEMLGGLMHSRRSVPENGAHTNFTQDTGIGCELQLADNVAWQLGYRYRHISHGQVFAGDPNPGQNDNVVYTGIAFTLP